MLVLALLMVAATPSNRLGGLVIESDLPQPTLFVSASGGVEALDAQTGRTRWRVPLAGSPLLVRDGKLLCAGGAVFDAGSGAQLFTVTGVPDERPGPGRTGGQQATTVNGEDYVSAGWTQCYAGGAAVRSPEPCTQGQSVMRIDWPGRKAVLAAIPVAAPEVSRTANEIAFRTSDGGSARIDLGRRGKPLLHPARGRSRTLLAGAAGEVRAFVSADRQDVLAIAPVTSAGGAPRELLAVYSAQTGTRRARCTIDAAGAPAAPGFLVRAGKLVWLGAPHSSGTASLLAWDLARCTVAWQRTIADPSVYVGPFPPMRPRAR